MLPSSRLSFKPVTVTVCAASQLAAVNVSDDGETVPSVVSFELTPTVTSAVGCAVSTTLNVAVPPASVVANPDVGETVNPDTSSSVFDTLTSAAFTLL